MHAAIGTAWVWHSPDSPDLHTANAVAGNAAAAANFASKVASYVSRAAQQDFDAATASDYEGLLSAIWATSRNSAGPSTQRRAGHSVPSGLMESQRGSLKPTERLASPSLRLNILRPSPWKRPKGILRNPACVGMIMFWRDLELS